MSNTSSTTHTNIKSQSEDIVLYTNRTSLSEYLKCKIEDQVDVQGLALNIKEVSDMDIIAEKGLMSLPAIELGGELLEIGQENIVSFTHNAIKKIMVEATEPRIKNVIIPTDFSSTANTAVQFGTRLASQLMADVEVLNVSRVEYSEDLLYENVRELNRIKQDMLSEQLEISRALWPDHRSTENKITSKVRTGFVAEQILEESNVLADALVVMGTKGAGSRAKQILGSVSTSVASKSEVPVLLIPPDNTVSSISNILLCVKDEELDMALATQLLPILKGTGADLTLLNLSRQAGYEASGIIDMFRSKVEGIKIKFHQMEAVPDPSILNSYAVDNNMDLIVLSTKPRTRIQKLFHSTYTYELALDAKLPLLILRK